MVRTEVALNSDAELMHRHRLPESGVLLHDNLAQRVLERGEVLPGVPHEVGRQLVVEGAQVVQVEHQPLFLPADHSMDLLHIPLLVEEVEEDALLLLILHRASGVSQPLNKEPAEARGVTLRRRRQVLERQGKGLVGSVIHGGI